MDRVASSYAKVLSRRHISIHCEGVRGDTIHPSTLELMHELGLLDEFLKQPHQEVRELRAVVNRVYKFVEKPRFGDRF